MEAPTKSNLIYIQNTLYLARQGYELLDKKQSVLVKENAELKEKIQKLKENIGDIIQLACKALIQANMEMGSLNVETISRKIPADDTIQLHFRSIMGVEIIRCAGAVQALNPIFELGETTMALDEAYKLFNEAKNLILAMAELENTSYRLTAGIRKTKKRANALRHVIIPKYEAQVKLIKEQLEEKERDGFVRLKMVKRTSGF